MKRAVLLAILLTVLPAFYIHAETHIVGRGETISSIAQKYGVSEAEIRAANPRLKTCYAGLKLNIPKPRKAPAGADRAANGNTPVPPNKNNSSTQKSGNPAPQKSKQQVPAANSGRHSDKSPGPTEETKVRSETRNHENDTDKKSGKGNKFKEKAKRVLSITGTVLKALAEGLPQIAQSCYDIDAAFHGRTASDTGNGQISEASSDGALEAETGQGKDSRYNQRMSQSNQYIKQAQEYREQAAIKEKQYWGLRKMLAERRAFADNSLSEAEANYEKGKITKAEYDVKKRQLLKYVQEFEEKVRTTKNEIQEYRRKAAEATDKAQRYKSSAIHANSRFKADSEYDNIDETPAEIPDIKSNDKQSVLDRMDAADRELYNQYTSQYSHYASKRAEYSRRVGSKKIALKNARQHLSDRKHRAQSTLLDAQHDYDNGKISKSEYLQIKKEMRELVEDQEKRVRDLENEIETWDKKSREMADKAHEAAKKKNDIYKKYQQ